MTASGDRPKRCLAQVNYPRVRPGLTRTQKNESPTAAGRTCSPTEPPSPLPLGLDTFLLRMRRRLLGVRPPSWEARATSCRPSRLFGKTLVSRESSAVECALSRHIEMLSRVGYSANVPRTVRLVSPSALIASHHTQRRACRPNPPSLL